MTENVIFNICSQRRKRQLFNKPNRIELEDTPYGGIYTMEQINMRRKAEILQYSPNKQSSQTNSTTKTQKYALIVNAPARMNNNKFVSGNPCPSNNLIPVPTSSSDVPGPIQYLIYDEKVTLYNDVNPISIRAYSNYSKINENLKLFDYNFSDNTVIIPDSDNNTILTLYFIIPSNRETIDLVIPIGVSFIGKTIDPPSPSITFSITNVLISIDNIKIELHYEGNKISSIPLDDINLNFEVNNYGNVNILKYVKTFTTRFTYDVTSKDVYDIKIKYTLNSTINPNNILNPNIKLIANITTPSNIISNNITIKTVSPSPNTYNPTFVSYKFIE